MPGLDKVGKAGCGENVRTVVSTFSFPALNNLGKRECLTLSNNGPTGLELGVLNLQTFARKFK